MADLVGWTVAAPDQLAASLHGVAVEVDLSGRSAPILVAVRNASERAVEVSMGAQATAARGSIGEVLVRPLRAVDTARSAGTSDYRPYAPGQTFAVGAGLGATFYLDRPLGRAPSYGQYFVFDLELSTGDGEVARRALPLVVRYARGSRPALR